VIAEIPAQTVAATLLSATWYYAVGMYRNTVATAELNEREGLMFLLLWFYAITCSTISQMIATIIIKSIPPQNRQATALH
jgi:ATP-binding cassette, subfamily G (WHITE), member 2, PDR